VEPYWSGNSVVKSICENLGYQTDKSQLVMVFAGAAFLPVLARRREGQAACFRQGHIFARERKLSRWIVRRRVPRMPSTRAESARQTK